ncbi:MULTISPECIES: cytochrome P450 [unclassified Gordonia (in: high G+C Gram-positive bacteria)]|uniref:cytochrome P450 n=1 Tax=unclassified Gordonia (in: high G+C Gram-positive bacteria) TaxID=2657482 RepID=UPI0007E98336|nr:MULTISPECIES: cytochrome P450 [unclassified Gordonia (in: high G+C Gram-positive bacteria)]OBB99637.1 hypothetical protein A5785_19875 [Gordonia sp. 852002-50395_SCH5434458]OBC13890.1 hypothetical protein A5788_18505 [Gordonia sp. 852002-50816_SCH5313054-c]OBC16198.1 hypothetical protein A5786_20690 [Gordonia sp. 852002-50816_SCH5313054-a]
MSEDTDRQAIDNAIADAATYSNPEIFHDLYSRLRRDEPVRWTQPDGHNPFWTISRYQDIMNIERAQQQWIAAPRTVLRTIEREESIRRVTGSSQPMHSMMHMDEPDHRKYRRITQEWFMPPNLRTLTDSLDELASSFLDDMSAAGTEYDFGEDVAAKYTIRALMKIIGVPAEDEDLMIDITQRFFSPADPSINKGKKIDLGNTLQGAFEYFNNLVAARRADPRDDLATLLCNATIDGEPLSDHDRNSYFFLLAIGGHDTTAISLSELLLALLQHPDQLERLREDRSLLPTAIDEGIRWGSPANHFMRTATADTEVAGTTIHEGEAVFLCYPSGNFDETAFDNPREFRIDRSPNRHLGFGFGVHQCLGQHLAKLEMTALFNQLLDRTESIELAGEPGRLASTFVSGVTSLPIRYRLRQAQLV